MTTTYTPDEIDRMAHRRASAVIGWYTHAAVYITVNLFLATISTMGGKHWAIFPMLGWSLGLAIHGLAVWLRGPQHSLREQLVARERNRLALQRDPW